jgi:transportin-3
MPQHLLNMAVSALSRTDSAGAGARALAQLCDHCGPALLPVMDSLMALYRTALYAGACGQLAAAGGSDGEAADAARTRLHGMNDDDVHLLVGAVCSATQRCVAPERLGAGAASLLQPLMDLLQHVLPLLPDPAQGQPSAGLSKAFPYLAPLVDRVATVLQSFTRPDVAAQLVTWAWPALDALIVRVGADAQVTERACRALRIGLKASGKAASGLLPALLDALPQRFRATRHPAFLYIFSELIKIFGDEPGRDAALAPVLQALLSDATAGLTGLRQLEAQPDLVDDVLLLVYRALGYCPRIVLTPPAASLPGLLNVAMLGTLMQHREACCSSLSFFVRLLEPRALEGCPPGASDARTAALLPRGPTLARLLLAGVAGCVQFSRVPDIAGALTAVLKACGPTGMQWLSDALALMPGAAVAASDCTVLLNAASVVCVGDTMGRPDAALDGPLSEFADLCRRTKRCSQAAQRALLPTELHPEFGLQ